MVRVKVRDRETMGLFARDSQYSPSLVNWTFTDDAGDRWRHRRQLGITGGSLDIGRWEGHRCQLELLEQGSNATSNNLHLLDTKMSISQ